VLPEKQPTRKQIGEQLGFSPEFAHKLIATGVFPKQGTMADYIAANNARLSGGGEQLDLTAERARVAKEQADKLEMENAVRRGELVDAEEATAVYRAEFQRCAVKLQGLPTKLAPLIVGCKSLAEVQDILSTGVGECLDELLRPDGI
jgi:hypothetical protein